MVGELGRGGYGVVSKAIHAHLGTVAVKEIPANLLRSAIAEKYRAELKREMELSRSLHHPNIVLLMGSSDMQTEYFIVTELVRLPSPSQLSRRPP